MGAWSYHGWQRHLPGVRVLPVELPGRNSRMREQPCTDLFALAKDIAAALAPLIRQVARSRVQQPEQEPE
jgi:surfactin synthase thioesterase subunit